jgi:hypothetical protein
MITGVISMTFGFISILLLRNKPSDVKMTDYGAEIRRITIKMKITMSLVVGNKPFQCLNIHILFHCVFAILQFN